jgi:monooxygenase
MARDHFDVIIVGAGLSGIGAAKHLQDNCPGKTYAILEGREAIGGTWDIFRYPGIRSDSDMYTLGYNFKPWRGAKSIADGASIRDYVVEAAEEEGITPNIRFNSMVKSLSWSTEHGVWNVDIEHPGTGDKSRLSCNLLSMCSGYYSYEEGYTPEFEGMADYKGQVIHPQDWPEDLDYTGKKIVVIGSGATAITLVPNLADEAEHVTMVQRSPTWVASRPEIDATALKLRKFLPEKAAYSLTRMKNAFGQQIIYKQSRTSPEKVRAGLVSLARKELPKEVVAEHFTASYNPWDERLCLIPDNDLFNAINDGSVSVITNTIERFTEDGLELTGGELLEADIIITATGLNLVQLGGASVSVDGERINFADTWTYKGMMYSGVPNLITTFGYINASWTLRADLIAEWTGRLINYMDKTGTNQATPTLRPEDEGMEAGNWIGDFQPGYVARTQHLYPKQGDHEPWINSQNYAEDKKKMRKGRINDGVLTFSTVVKKPFREALPKTAAE